MAKTKRRRLLARLLLGMLALGALFFLWLLAVWPPPLWYRSHWPKRTAFMVMREDQARDEGDTLPPRRYTPVPLARIAPAMAQAVIVAEDQRFLQHGGIDYAAIRDAMGYRRHDFAWTSGADLWELLRALGRSWSRRDRVRGASTITQQLAKNLYLSPSRNPLRKVKEAVTAWRLERALGKRRILELYLNTVELGENVWGVEAASRLYFHHSAAALDRAQAAALAATLPFPLSSNPGHRPKRMRTRQALILRRMRGERITVPPEDQDEDEAPPAARRKQERDDDADPPAHKGGPAMDSLLDSLRAPIETLPPAASGP